MRATGSAAGCTGARLLAAGCLSPILWRVRRDVRAAAADLPRIVGPRRDGRTRSVLDGVVGGWSLIVTTLIAAEDRGLGFAFDPPLQGFFRFSGADHGGGAVRRPDAGQPSDGRACARLPNPPLPGRCWWPSRGLHGFSTRARRNWQVDVDQRRFYLGLAAYAVAGAGPCKSQNKQARSPRPDSTIL